VGGGQLCKKEKSDRSVRTLKTSSEKKSMGDQKGIKAGWGSVKKL